MLHISRLEEGLDVFKALGSELRIEIIKQLLKNREMNINELAGVLGVTNGALTSHIRRLEESGLVEIMPDSGSGHGNQKVCRVAVDKILIEVASEGYKEEQDVYAADIPVGQYLDYEIRPTCGLASESALIGEVDDPRYFAHPGRVAAEILWFGKGYVEYGAPVLIPPSAKVEQVTLSMEIGSEAPGVNSDWPSDICFWLNGVRLGMWTSPGDFGPVRGILTPDWWPAQWNQYGMLKTVMVNRKGTFLDGLKLSDVTVDRFGFDYRSTLRFRLEALQETEKGGGLTIFGSKFGNYNQAIQVKILYGR